MHRPVESKIYVLVRSDLAPGLQLAQAVHAATAFALAHPERASSTPNVVVLAVPDEAALLSFADSAGVVFREPDVGDEATAFATVSDSTRFSCLPLAGRVLAMSP